MSKLIAFLQRYATLGGELSKELAGVDAVCSVVRTGINTAWLVMIKAEIAGSRLLPYLRDLFPRCRRVVYLDVKGMQIDVAVRTVVRAQPASDAPILDDHLQAVLAPNRPDRTAHHTKWVFALPARSRDQVLVESQTVPDETANPVVRIGAGPHTLVASRTAIQVQHEKALRFHQP